MKLITYYFIGYLTLGMVCLSVTLWLFKVFIIQRLQVLTHQVRKINKNNAHYGVIENYGDDEISSLSNYLQALINFIDTSQEKIETQVKERTKKLKMSNIKMQQEIIERKLVEKELRTHKKDLAALAHYDHLTSLPNLVFFTKMINQIMSRTSREKIKLALLYIDLDHFKKINDAFGHNVGDLALKEMANRFLKVLRVDDIAARSTADKFIILLNPIDNLQFVHLTAEKILKISSQPMKINMHEFILTASVGIAIYPQDGTSLEKLIKYADKAMYQAKHAGGNAFSEGSATTTPTIG
jgi:diguanylate cyclase (GGDEF)-like protein